MAEEIENKDERHKNRFNLYIKKKGETKTAINNRNQRIEWKRKVKYLGVTFDDKFKWDEHIMNKRNITMGTYKKLYPILAQKT